MANSHHSCITIFNGQKFLQQISLTISLCLWYGFACAQDSNSNSIKFLRFEIDASISFGILRNETIYAITGNPFTSYEETENTYALSEVTILPPCDPSKVIAVGLNYQSHLGERKPAEYPGLFSKFPSSIIGHEQPIILPADAGNLHYEGELVVVIGKEAKNITVDEAPGYIFGVTAGNDLSERDWQRADLQWFRAKGSDSFGPVGPVIVTGLEYNNLLLQTRVNGEVVQSERTKDLIFNVEEIVSYISRYVTLLPGDIIFTGTPQTTSALRVGDVVEVEIEGVGILRNTVTQSKD